MTIIRILIVVALQTAALAYMIVDRQAMLNSAQVVTLKVVPVDPNDMFRGEYVILGYDISRLDLTKLDGDDKMTYGDTIFVTLVPDGEAWKPVAVKRERPFEVQGGIALKGKVGLGRRRGRGRRAPSPFASATASKAISCPKAPARRSRTRRAEANSASTSPSTRKDAARSKPSAARAKCSTSREFSRNGAARYPRRRPSQPCSSPRGNGPSGNGLSSRSSTTYAKHCQT